MSKYQIFLVGMAVIAIIGIFVLVIDYSNLKWNNNKESYWGVIAMLALIGAILMNNRSINLDKKIKSQKK